MGDQLLAYDLQTSKSPQTVEQVWINHDNVLIDLTLRTASDSVQHAPAEANASNRGGPGPARPARSDR